MKKIGIIGGLGPESTVDYYKRIISFFHHHNRSFATPDIIFYSVNLAEVFSLVREERWEQLTDMLVTKLVGLKDAGADFAAISANTPHVVFDQVAGRSPLPLISIVDVTLQEAKRQAVRKVGLLGTSFTMQTNFFGSKFAGDDIAVVVPTAEEQQFIQEKLEAEIELGIMKDETRQALAGIIKGMQKRDGIEAAILGCTELPLLLVDPDADIPLLNTTALHVEAICKMCLGN